MTVAHSLSIAAITAGGAGGFEHPAARENARFDPLPWALDKG